MSELHESHSIFMREIVASPYDDAPRLIYADFLEELSDPRGEFIRVQCELAQLDPLSGDFYDRNVRNLELLGMYRQEWLSQMQLPTQNVFFERGFIRLIKTRSFSMHHEVLPTLTPITRLWLESVDQQAREAAKYPCLNHVHDLRMTVGWGDKLKASSCFNPILKSSHLSRIESLRLDLRQSAFDAATAEAIAGNSDTLKRLEITFQRPMASRGAMWDKLDMSGIEHFGLHKIHGADSRDGNIIRGIEMPNLKSLFLGSASLGILRHLQTENLANLHFDSCDRNSIEALCDQNAFSKLRRLQIRNCAVADLGKLIFSENRCSELEELLLIRTNSEFQIEVPEFASALLNSRACDSLKILHLANYHDGKSKRTMDLPLERLHLTHAKITDAETFFGPMAEKLRELTIVDSQIANLGGLQFPKLRRLVIHRTELPDADLELARLIEGGAFPEIVAMRLVGCQLGAKTVAAFASTTECPELRFLDFADNNAKQKQMEEILDSPRLPLLRRIRFPVYPNKGQSRHGTRLQLSERNEAGLYYDG